MLIYCGAFHQDSRRAQLLQMLTFRHVVKMRSADVLQGPQLQVAYRVSLASAIAVRSKRSLDADDSADPPPAAPTPRYPTPSQ